jgi:hypothetical protein
MTQPDSTHSAAAAEREWLAEFLRERDAACPLCAYNLRGLASERCPECGREVRLSVGLADPYVRAWVAALASVGAGAGIGILMAVILLRQGWPPSQLWLLHASLVYFLACIPALGVLLVTRRAFLRRSRTAQRRIAAWAVSLLVVAILAFLAGLD